jgi:hypothetical protein
MHPSQARANPVDTTLSDLAAKYRGKPAEWAALSALLRGSASTHGSVRAAVCGRASGPYGVTPRCASAQEQAACLVELATDASLLGRAWRGWRPWL